MFGLIHVLLKQLRDVATLEINIRYVNVNACKSRSVANIYIVHVTSVDPYGNEINHIW